MAGYKNYLCLNQSESFMEESWREPHVGDRIRIVRFPSDWVQEHIDVAPRTRELYERLIERRRSVRVFEICDQGLPWIQC